MYISNDQQRQRALYGKLHQELKEHVIYMTELPKMRASLISIAKRFENAEKINAQTAKASETKDKKPMEPN